MFGFYSGLAYSAPILSGLLADRALGRRRTVILGGLFMAAGHFMMAFESLFLLALAALIIGVGAFEPNISVRSASSMRRTTSAALALTRSSVSAACLCVAIANLLMAGAAFGAAPGEKASGWWLVGYFGSVTVGELFLAPVGLALITATAPARLRAMMMGVWFGDHPAR